mmetsp:Transcript_6548/g.14271  ORF Transcript_6548/g.14271 Transcript_6548/m.14271 type:complete len:382 (-) Transcript_6548:608-1753(-)
MKTILLAALLSAESVYGFGSVPGGGANAVELPRSECQDIFFGKGDRRNNPLQIAQTPQTTVCGLIEEGTRNLDVRVARLSKTNTAEWCNQGGRKGDPTACSQAYALVGRQFTLCEYNTNTGDCLLSQTSQRACRASPDVCSTLRAARDAGGPDIVSLSITQSFDFLCSLLTTKETCNNRVFVLTGTSNPTLEDFATCAFDGTKCSGIGPHSCPVTERRELEAEAVAANKRKLQDGDVCSIFTTRETCNNGYTYTSGVAYDYDQYSSTNLPPALAICEWSAGRCSTARTCPYMCELAADRNVDVPGTVDTDATLTFGDRALETFCEADIDRAQRASVCENFYRVESTSSPLAPRQVTACRHAVGNSGPFCTREVRPGFNACI